MQIVKNAVARQLCDANGSAKSIIKWGCKCNFNKHQRCAFEVIMASFVLTCFKDAAKNNEKMTTHDNQSRPKFVRENNTLLINSLPMNSMTIEIFTLQNVTLN